MDRNWYDGMTFEAVAEAMVNGTAPGSSEVGGVVEVPDGFNDWWAEANRRAGGVIGAIRASRDAVTASPGAIVKVPDRISFRDWAVVIVLPSVISEYNRADANVTDDSVMMDRAIDDAIYLANRVMAKLKLVRDDEQRPTIG